MAFRVRFSIELPSRKFQDIHINTALAQAQRTKTANDLLSDFRKTVEGWEKRPSFTVKQMINSQRVSVSVFPSGTGLKQYSIVNFGSPPHVITARRPGGFLRFQTGYIPATIPGQIFSHRKQRFGRTVRSYYVNHPGFEPRRFDIAIADNNRNAFAQDMQDAVNLAVKTR